MADTEAAQDGQNEAGSDTQVKSADDLLSEALEGVTEKFKPPV